MTQRLFDVDSYNKEFTAKVISCVPSGDNYKVVLDRTTFFPEGGGQAADKGTLNQINVLDVQEKDGIIYHIVSDSFDEGAEVNGKIDWDVRFERMQHHTGEHIVTGLIHAKYGYNNVGFHLSDGVCTLDMSGPLTKEQLQEIEIQANEIIYQNRSVEVLYPTKEELETLDYRSKIEIEGQIRIVKVDGCDICACCAPHVRSTGEIGVIKMVQTQNYKGGVRITIACGRRALRDYSAKDEYVKAIMYSLSSKEELIVEGVELLKKEIAQLKSKVLESERERLRFKTQEIATGQRTVCLFEERLDGNLPRDFMNMVLDKDTCVCAVFTGNETSGFRYVIGSRTQDMRPISKALNAEFSGRGGGKPEMVQGSLVGTKAAIETKVCKCVETMMKKEV